MSAEMTPQPRTRGAALISQERGRQIIEKLWTPEHDDEFHRGGELVLAAAVYASPFALYVRADHPGSRGVTFYDIWPHDWDYHGGEKADGRGLDRDAIPTYTVEDRIRELTKAGALIAAEIDRLGRTL